MAYDELLAERIRDEFLKKEIGWEEKRMMGGLCFMVDGKMCVGVVKSELMARLDPGIYGVVLEEPDCREMDFTGRPMKGYVFIDEDGVDKRLAYWLDLALEYNPKAKASKKRKK